MAEEPHIQTLQPGAQLGEYTIVGMLGKGGMGEVYLAEHAVMHKYYALKVLPRQVSSSPHFISRFKIEARVMADLEHPNIVRVHHLGHVDDCYFLTMDFVEYTDGTPRTLEEEIATRGSLPEKEVVHYALQMCHALEYAHSFRGQGVIHRDLKPANVLLGPNNTVKIADFGIAKIVGAEYLHSMLERSIGVTHMAFMSEAETRMPGDTASGIKRENSAVQAIIGTYDYMSPEQKEGRPASPQSDLFALGVILYRMITGKKPEGIWQMPSTYGAGKAWDTIIATCMQREPGDRYRSVRDLREALEAVARTRPGLAGRGMGKPLYLAAGALLLVAGGYLGMRQWQQPPSSPPAVPTATPAPPLVIAPAPSAGQTTLDLRRQATEAHTRLRETPIDPANGIQPLLTILEKDWDDAETAFREGRYDEAQDGYLDVLRQLTNLKAQDQHRAQAVGHRDATGQLLDQAEKAGAGDTATAEMEEARQLQAYSDKALAGGSFDEAIKGYQLASESYRKAADTAKAASLHQRQAEAYDKARTLAGPSRLNRIQQYEPEGWTSLQDLQRTGADTGRPYPEREQAYRGAAALLERLLVSSQAAYDREQRELAAKSAREKEEAARIQAEKDRQLMLARQQAEAAEKARLAREAAARKPTPTPAPTPRPAVPAAELARRRSADPLQLPVAEGVTLPLKRLTAGHFTMGHDVKKMFGSSDESPEHRVEFRQPFWIGVHEVTQAEYEAVMGINPSRIQGPDLPVETVSWFDAMAFCSNLTQTVSTYLGDDRYTVRLPTEAEWEYACRAGTDTPYANGDDVRNLAEIAWCAYNARKTIHPVATLAPNAFGLYDMHGNVWEWCYDYYGADYYANSPVADPMGPEEGRVRIVRGGSFEEREHCRSHGRWQVNPAKGISTLGFRIVISQRKE